MEVLETDVVIVGAGPGGSSTAFTAAKKGLHVIVVDKKSRSEIGDKVCGDGLSPDYYHDLAELIDFPVPDEDFKQDCNELVFLTSDGNRFTMPSRSGTVDRLKYGQKIIAELEKMDNITILPDSRFHSVLVENEFVKGIEVIRNGAHVQIQAKVTVDSSGTYSVIRKHLPEDLPVKFDRVTPRENRFVAYREHIRLEEPHPFNSQLVISHQDELNDLGAAYYWIFSRDQYMVNVGLGYLLNEENRGKNIAELNRKITQKIFPDGTVLSSRGDQIPARLPLYSCVFNGMMLVGDAAGLANPLNGEGHGHALEAGYQAGLTLAEAISANDWSETGLWGYNIYIWHYFGVLFSWGIALIRVMNRTGSKFIDDVVKNEFLTEEEISTIVSDTDNSVSPWFLLKRGWRHPGILWKMFTIKRHADKIRKMANQYPEHPGDGFEEWREKVEELADYY